MKEEVKNLLKQALLEKSFPSKLIYPEYNVKFCNPNPLQIWNTPYLCWVPEVMSKRDKNRPFCIKNNCSCLPSPYGYLSRSVQDIDHVTVIMFIEYQCNDKKNKNKTIFNTVSKEFIRKMEPELAEFFPYYISKRSGASLKLLQLVHEGIMQPKGLAPVIKSIEGFRKNRYFMLIRYFSQQVN